MANQSWTRSTREEVIGVLWLIAGLLAYLGNLSILACLLALKAGGNGACAVEMAWADRKKARKENRHV